VFTQTIYWIHQVFFNYTLNIPYELDRIPFPKQKKRLPTFFLFSEVQRIIENSANLKHRTMLTLVYSSGLRTGDLINLTADDIIRDKMLIRINQGKGNKDRYTILSSVALKLLEKYWRTYRPNHWLFPGKSKNNKISRRACQHAFEIAKKKTGITRKGGLHSLRHSFATHFLEVGGGLFQLQRFLGHKQLRTTLKYVHLSEEKVIARSPLDVFTETDSK